PIQLHIERGLSSMTTASTAIKADSAGQPCVVTAYWVPELMWYSGCDGIQARWPPSLLRVGERVAKRALVLFAAERVARTAIGAKHERVGHGANVVLL